MKKLRVFLLLSVLVLATNLLAQNHVLISEFVVTPTAGEFIEIYNPTSDSVDLGHHYVTDAISNNNNHYTTIVQGGFTVQSSSDFMAKFPDSTKIGPGQHMTVAFSGTGFTGEYGVPADFEIKGDDAATPDMTPIDVGGSAGLSNSGEAIIVFYWDGVNDLVKDVDIVVWGDQNEAVDKTGLKIDGIDADTDSSTYANDTPVADQYVVNADNDADANPHDFGSSAQRRLDVEDVETWTGGNGITGHDETSENTSWLSGGIWSINEPATPGYRALGRKSAADSLTIADLQFIRADSIGTNANEDSPFLGDTVTVTGVVMNGIREIFLGARWGSFIQDARGGPWSGYFVIQDDSAFSQTLLNAALPGDLIRMTGELQEFPTDPNTQSISETSLFFNPATPIEILQSGVPLPDPILLKPSDIGATGSSEDPRLTERLESTLARFEGLTVMSNSPGQAGNIMTAGDATGTIAIDDYFLVLRDMLDNQTGGEWPGFPVGTVINITGFVRDVQSSNVGRTTINPRSLDDIEIASAPPVISRNVTREPVVVASSDAPTLSTVIQSATSTIASATLNYRIDGGAFQQVAMSTGSASVLSLANAAADSLYSGSIPAQADGALVEYFISAKDAGGLEATTPGDTSSSLLFYFVRDAGLSIFDLQFTPFADGNSQYSGLDVTVPGIVTTDSADFSFYFIQNGTAAWNGIWVQDNTNNVKLGDSVSVTGTVEERFNATRINNVTSVTILSSGNTVPEPVVVPTGDLAVAATGEQWESMLVRVENVGVANPFADGSRNFGEFTVDDGSGEVRVDDLGNFRGNLDTAFVATDSLISLTGIHYFTFGNYKIEPRNDNDVIRLVTSVNSDDPVPFTFELSQNYPNPFNPETTIRYQVGTPGDVTINIYNILGQRVKTLVDAFQPTGAYTVQWRGINDRGLPVSSGVYIYHMKASDFVQVKKMLFLK